MNAQEQAILAGLGADAKAALKALLQEVVDKDLPALITAEEAKLPAAYAPIVSVVVSAALPSIQKLIDDKIAAI